MKTNEQHHETVEVHSYSSGDLLIKDRYQVPVSASFPKPYAGNDQATEVLCRRVLQIHLDFWNEIVGKPGQVEAQEWVLSGRWDHKLSFDNPDKREEETIEVWWLASPK